MNRLVSLIFFSLVFSNVSFAQPGANDPTFNILNDGYFGDGLGFNSTVFSTSIQNDGKILIGGGFYEFNGIPTNQIARLNVDGSLDVSFNFNSGSGFNSLVNSTLVQNDGKIIVGGEFTSFNGVPSNRIARLNTDGSLDNTFNTIAGFNNSVYSICIQNDGKIVVVGGFTSFNGTPINRIARLNVDGSLDVTFNPGTGFNNLVRSICIQSDGKIITGGNFTSCNGTARNRIARLNTDGSLDATFNPGTGFDDLVYTASIQSDGKIIVGGSFYYFNGTSRNRIARLNTDGSLDATFNTGSGFNNSVFSTIVQSDGKIMIGGWFTTFNGVTCNYISRLNTNGSMDVNFNTSIGLNNDVRSISIQSDGKIITGGSFTTFNGIVRNRIARLNANGKLDAAGFNNAVHSVLVQNDGKILVGGFFTSFNGADQNFMTRLNTEGDLDTTFSSGTGFGPIVSFSGAVESLSLQSDGKILVGGWFTTFNGIPINRIARLNTDGTLDATFNPGSGLNNAVTEISIQNDGKILIGGLFNGMTENHIARLNMNGSLDTSFDTGIGFDGPVESIIVQSDGKILISGNFTSYNGVLQNGIARLNTDGSLDTTFNVGIGFDYVVLSLTIQNDGRILVGGNFTSYNGIPQNRITRLNTDGSLDTTFNSGTGFNGTVRSIVVQNDGKLLVGGYFTMFDGAMRANIARLNANGSLDTSLDPNSGFNDGVWILNIQSDEKILAGGTFTSYKGESRNRVTRLLNCSPISILYTVTSCNSYSFNNQTYTVSGQYIDTIPNAAGCDSIITLDLTIVPSLPLVIANSFSLPSDANSCTGEVAVTVSGNAPFELDFDNGSQVITSNGYSLVTGLCAGVHDLHITDNCGDTLSVPAVIPVDSNFVFNNPFIDSLAQDSLGVTLTNCDIYYAGIDTAYIDSIWANGNTVNVIWNIVDSNGSNFDTTSYVLNNGNGVYWLQLSVFCPNKSLGEYFTVTEAISFYNGHAGTAGLMDPSENHFEIYPNPTNDQVHITFSGPEAELTVYDAQGKVVLKNRIQNQGIVSLQNFERGVYLFDFKNAQGQGIQRVVKQ